jgi:hypothetical protein
VCPYAVVARSQVERGFGMSEWCMALADKRAALERARDARVGRLADPVAWGAFADALSALDGAEKTHRSESGCALRH